VTVDDDDVVVVVVEWWWSQVVKVSGVSLLALFKEKKEKPRS